jgi:hypothetical protein
MKNLVGKTIKFTSGIEYMEAYPEAGMRARIKSVNHQPCSSKLLEDQLYIIVFDYSEFDEFNAALESSNYYDKDGVACLTARQAKMYEPQEDICFSAPEVVPFETYFTLLDERQSTLIARFKESGMANYVEWLESQISI